MCLRYLFFSGLCGDIRCGRLFRRRNGENKETYFRCRGAIGFLDEFVVIEQWWKSFRWLLGGINVYKGSITWGVGRVCIIMS